MNLFVFFYFYIVVFCIFDERCKRISWSGKIKCYYIVLYGIILYFIVLTVKYTLNNIKLSKF